MANASPRLKSADARGDAAAPTLRSPPPGLDDV